MKRIIMHLDMDSYFASVEQQARPALRGRPIGVTGRPSRTSIITAFSREAKVYPVRAGMPAWEAFRACPNLQCVAGHPEQYLSVTKRFVSILKEYTAVLEVYSVDEVFMDLSQEVPSYDAACALAREIKHRFRGALGSCITATMGFASSKTFAKLIGKKNKPDGIGVLSEAAFPELLRTTPVGDVCGIGPRITDRLNRVGIRTLAELGGASTEYLKREFGVYGLWLHAVGQGKDPTPVASYTELPPPKSVGHSKSLPPDMRALWQALVVLRGLCDNVGRRMRRLEYVGRTVHCGFRMEIGRHYGKQTTLHVPTDDGETIYRACLRALAGIPIKPTEVSNIGVSVSNLIEHDRVPGFLLETDRKQEQLNQAIDRVRDRFGAQAIRRGSSLLLRPIAPHVGGFFTENEDMEFAEK